ncbi:MAG TPA: phosphoribosylglycinamide formyltransferase [Flavisolibacter sp.]|nr:phosphoribosylglycinamide formyltransferase [Flavisolibacter sp.]
MFKRLQEKWKVSPGRLFLILVTFAIGGSLTGYLGRRIMPATGIESKAVYVPVYVVLITFIWPFMVLLVSIFTGQFLFFRSYLAKMGQRMGIGRTGSSSLSAKDGGTARQQHSSKSASMSQNNISPETRQQRTVKLAIFASGAGSNAQKLIEFFSPPALAEVSLIVCNKQGAGVIQIAEKSGIPVLMIEKERFFRGDGHLADLQSAGIDLVVLAGFLWKIPQSLIDAFPRRIINIHPALLPKYGGKGMYGAFVHQAVIGAGELQSGITIHYVDEHYDNGDIIFQTACPVLEGDTPEDLARRVHELEHAHYPRVVEEEVKKLAAIG